ncbi:MAG TPA: glutathione S-transferase family protein [Xanthobacteraceae bacterium]|nr:glutathione S-transferase family protein [Xanthobacteraceae bacterium]
MAASLTLVIGNKNYSSWSMRPWLALTHNKIQFQEILVPIYEEGAKEKIRKHSPSGKLPVLIDGDRAVWESLAILDYLAEKLPQLGLWPAGPGARAHARAIAAEMHAGFRDLRLAAPMNLKREPRPIELSVEAQADVARITAIWTDTRRRFARGGSYLFGGFGAADCMFAPVATRIRNYAIKVDPISADYVEAIYKLPAFRAWREAGLKEPWTSPYDSI